MPEQLDLTAPTRTFYQVTLLHCDWPRAHIDVGVTGSDGIEIIKTYDGDPATTRMLALNTANLTVKSLDKRLLEMLVTDGKLPPGSVSGVPR